MAFRHGRWAEVIVNSVDMSTFCDSMDFNVDTDTAETTTFTDVWKTHVTGTSGGELQLAGNYDPTETTGPADTLEALIGQDATTVVAKPGGSASGQRSRTFSGILTSYHESSKVADKVTFEATFLMTGAPTLVAI